MLSEIPYKEPLSREGINLEKLMHTGAIFLNGKTRKIDAYLDSFDHIDSKRLERLTGKQIQSLIIDIDACIAEAYGPILPHFVEHIKALQNQGIKIGILSNCKSMDRLNVLKELGIPVYEGKHPKPAKEAYMEASAQFGFDPQYTWMVGDNPNTDGGAVSVLGGVIIVKAIPDNKEFLTKMKYLRSLVQNAVRALTVGVSVYKNPHLIRSADLQHNEHLGTSEEY